MPISQCLYVIGAERPVLGAERPRNRGGTTAFGEDVGRIDPGRIDSGADRPVPAPTSYPVRLITVGRDFKQANNNAMCTTDGITLQILQINILVNQHFLHPFLRVIVQ